MTYFAVGKSNEEELVGNIFDGYPILLFTETCWGKTDDKALGYIVIPQSVP